MTEIASELVAAGTPRAVILVGGPAAPYSRGLRLARTLVALGYRVEIAAVAAAGLPEREPGEGWELRRYVPSGPWARFSASRPVGPGADPTSSRPAVGLRRFVRRIVGVGAALRRWIFWPHTVRGWWATLDRELEPADLYHACGSLTVSAALRARARSPIGPHGRPAAVIYDAIDDVFESNNILDMPGVLRTWHARRERGWARTAEAVITVNEALADRLAARWSLSPRPDVVPNYPEAPLASLESLDSREPPLADLIRAEAGLAAATHVILFQGRLGPRLGLDEAAEATLLVPDAALVLIGFGRGYERESARDHEARFAGRHFTLPARHPDVLLGWTASADVALVPLPPASLNQRLSSPNKFWEALVAGTPVVVSKELAYMAGIVRERDLGVVAESAGAADLAAAISACLAKVAGDPAWRGRIRTLAAADFSWPVAARTYRAVVERLA